MLSATLSKLIIIVFFFEGTNFDLNNFYGVFSSNRSIYGICMVYFLKKKWRHFVNPKTML